MPPFIVTIDQEKDNTQVWLSLIKMILEKFYIGKNILYGEKSQLEGKKGMSVSVLYLPWT